MINPNRSKKEEKKRADTIVVGRFIDGNYRW